MLSAERALALIAERAAPLPARRVPLPEAVGRVLALDLRARGDLPPFDNSAMDGYAVRSDDLREAGPDSPVRLALLGGPKASVSAARAQRVGAGQAARVLTGGAIPPGADAVLMQEFARVRGGILTALRALKPGRHVRPLGEDVRAREPLLKKGTRLRPYEIGLLAAQGFATVPVHRRPRAVVLATGNELLGAGVRNADGPALAAALARAGLDVEDAGIAPDDPRAIVRALSRRSGKTDLLLVCGGTSQGDFDFTRPALKQLGFKEVFGGVAIKPGKPLCFAARGRALAFGLPGNPVAALVCLEEFVRPAWERLSGRAFPFASFHLRAAARNAYPGAAGRRQYLFCEAAETPEGYVLSILRPQGSALLSMACRADALATVPPGSRGVRPGDTLAFRWLK